MVQRHPWFPIISLVSLTLLITAQASFAATSSQLLTDRSQQRVIVKDSRSQTAIVKANNRYYMRTTGSSGKTIDQRQIAPNELIVKFKNVPSLKETGYTSVSQTARRLAAQTRPLDQSLGLVLIKLSSEQSYFTAMEALCNHPSVDYAEPNYMVSTEATPNDPYYPKQWNLSAIQAESAWEAVPPAKRAAVTIAILDTGITKNHEDLQASIVPGYDFVSNDSDPEDRQGHGTHVAGIAAGISNNGMGISGIASGSRIMPVKVLDDNGNGSYATIISGIKYAADHGANVINLSLGSAGTSSAMQDAVNYATSRGANVVAASGNSSGPVMFPANCDGVIAVGAIDHTGNRAYYSNFGPKLDVVAPGSDITSTFMSSPSGYAVMSGTSMAAPAVSGVVALVRAANPALTPAAVTDIIQKSATDLGTAGFDHNYGYGLVNALKAVQLATSSTTATGTASTSGRQPAIPPILANQPMKNLALKKKVTASSIEGPARQAAYAADGNSATRWASAEKADPQWITIDLGKTSLLTKFVLTWEAAYARAWQLQLSDDGINWTTVYSTTSGTGGVTTLTGAVKGRYVRLLGTSRGTPYGYSLWEIEVYGQ